MKVVIKHSIGQIISRNIGFIIIDVALFAIGILVKLDGSFSSNLRLKLAKIVEHFDPLDYDDRGYVANDSYLLDVSQGDLLCFAPDDDFEFSDAEYAFQNNDSDVNKV